MQDSRAGRLSDPAQPDQPHYAKERQGTLPDADGLARSVSGGELVKQLVKQ